MRTNRYFRTLASLILALCCAATAFAQEQTTQQNAQDQPVARPVPQRTVGLEPGKVVRWTLRDAIITALDKNVDIELERENVRLQQYDLIALQGFYDPLTTSTVLYNKAINPTSFRFAGDQSGTILRDNLTYNFGLRKNLEKYGSLVEVDFNNSRQGSNTNNLSVQYAPAFTVNLTQPLFKNFKIDSNRRQIKLTKKRLDLSDAQFRQKVIDIISQVQQAYWNLALAIRSEEIARDSVKLAETQLNNNKRQVEVGTLAPIDVVSAATQLESRRQQVFQAMDGVALAENSIKALTVGGTNDDLWNARVEPVESFDIKPVSMPLADAVKLAQENRPEVKQQSLQKDINRIDIDFFRDQSKPQIDLIASYSTSGLGGTPAVTTGTVPNCAAPVLRNPSDPNSGLVCTSITARNDGAGNFIPVVNTVAYNPAVPFTQTAPVSPDFIGSYGTSLKNLLLNDFRTWSVGVQFNFPLRNRTAKANLARAQEQERQTDLQTRRLLQNIEVEVRNAVQSVETAKMRIEAATAAKEYAAKQLEGEEKKFAAGLSTTFFILDRQNQLSQARFDELRALADYNKSVATLQRVLSTTLSSNSIEVKTEAPVTIK